MGVAGSAGRRIHFTAVFCAVLCCAACEPELQLQLAEGHAYSEVITLTKLKALLRIPSNWLIVAQVGTTLARHISAPLMPTQVWLPYMPACIV
jgi:hypothetical protein